MPLAIFDLDNTLIAGDSDHSWGEFLIEQNIVDKEQFKQANDQFYEDYKAGNLDIFAYASFILEPLKTISQEELSDLQKKFLKEKIYPLQLPKAAALIKKHTDNQDTVMIITATNRIITAPIAKLLGIDILLATDPEIIDGKITGNVAGIPCFQEGKVKRLNQWINENNASLNNSYFYSDSFNDIPLLETVTYPYAVDPDEKLQKHAETNNWPIITLR